MAKQAFTEVIVEEILCVGSDDFMTTSLEIITLEDELAELAVSFCLKKKLIQLFVGGGGSLFKNFVTRVSLSFICPANKCRLTFKYIFSFHPFFIYELLVSCFWHRIV